MLPPGVGRSGLRVAMLTNSGNQTLPPANRRTTGLGHQTTDYACQQPYNSSKSYHYHHQQHHQQKRRSDTSEPSRFKSVTLPRRDVVVTGTGNGRSTLATGSPPATGRGSGGRSRLTPAVSDADIAGGSAHLSPRGGATDVNRRRATATRSNHVGGLISTSMLALPDTSI